MVYTSRFKVWLAENSSYSSRVISDVISRVKRADRMLEWSGEDIYQFRLGQLEEYKMLSVSVRSQMKKAVKLYAEFWSTQKEKVE